MQLATLFRRSLSAAASRDNKDRIKKLVLFGARTGRSIGFQDPPVDGGLRCQSVVKLLQYTFPWWDTPIFVSSREPEAYLSAARSAGYGLCVAGEMWHAQARPADGTAVARNSAVAVIVDLLEWMTPGALSDFLSQLEAAGPSKIAASIATYPECIFHAFERSGWPSIFERRSWWEELFSRHGFDAEQPPRENLQGLRPFLFRRRAEHVDARNDPRERRERMPAPRTIFVMPETQNAFRWVTESLAEALTRLGRPAAVVGLDADRTAARQPAPQRIGWPHYWRDYRELANNANLDFEIFVTNFEMEPRNTLTPWVRELCERDSVKLAVSNFCRNVLIGLGVPGERVHVVTHGFSPEFAQTVSPLPLATHKSFRFLAVVNSHDPYRYGTDILLNAYRRAFCANDDVCLVIKDYGMNSAATASWFDCNGGPEILYYANFVPKSELAAFYAACSAFVAPFRGEGFGMKILDAAVAGLPLIVPLYGGPADYCVPELVQPIAFERRPVGKCLDTGEIEWNEEITWCEPGVSDLADRMRQVFENRDAAAAGAMRLRAVAMEQFSWEAAARKLIAILE